MMFGEHVSAAVLRFLSKGQTEAVYASSTLEGLKTKPEGVKCRQWPFKWSQKHYAVSATVHPLLKTEAMNLNLNRNTWITSKRHTDVNLVENTLSRGGEKRQFLKFEIR